MEVFGFIFARGGSKGLPGKNGLEINGKPLIGLAIEVAKSAERISRVLVSTDSDELAQIALRYGAEVPFLRPENLSEDNSPELFAWQHALNFLSATEGSLPDAMVSLPPTAPLRAVEDVDRCLDKYERDKPDVVVTVTDAARNPYFNQIILDKNQRARIAMGSREKISRRQDVPPVFDLTTIAYVASTGFVLNTDSLFEGEVATVHIPPERAIDIDTELDFKIATFLAENRADL